MRVSECAPGPTPDGGEERRSAHPIPSPAQPFYVHFPPSREPTGSEADGNQLLVSRAPVLDARSLAPFSLDVAMGNPSLFLRLSPPALRRRAC